MKKLLLSFLVLSIAACSQNKGEEGIPLASVGVPETPLTIHDPSQLIGGPMAQGRVGDVLLSNSKIKVIIQKPTKNAGIGSFGGTIIDAYPANKKEGQDQWGEIFPMVNIEWTVNAYNYEVPAGMEGKEGGPQVLRTQGRIDVYDYLDLDWVADAASAVLNSQISFADRFDDRRDPFKVHDELRDLSPEVMTEYRLDPGTNYVQIKTTFSNPSKQTISFPVGEFLVGGGALQLLIPGLGFSPPPTAGIGDNTSAVIYAAFDDGDVSYGYFYNPLEFVQEEDKTIYKTTSVSYSGLTGVLLGEEFLKILPVGAHTPPEIHFSIAPESTRTITRYFIVGDGSAGSVFDTGLKILKVPTAMISGQVISAEGAPIEGATVAVKKQGGNTVVTYRTDPFGQFSGLLPKGEGSLGSFFGDGRYEVLVEKNGFHENGSSRAGSCSPTQIDLRASADVQVTCRLGETGRVTLNGVIDADTGLRIPARLTILGEDPSPETKGSGTFSDTTVFSRPFGIQDVYLINAKGGIGLSDKNYFQLEPGVTYRFVFSHGPEYSIVEREVTVGAGGGTSIEQVALKKVIDTSGFVSADFHVHAMPSPDSAFSIERRGLAAAADGLDVLQSSDHDFLTDYGPVVTKLAEAGIINFDSIQTIVGDEITPNHYGHLHAFPLTVNLDDPDHGAL
ncbi:MAG: carboxypeptidase regulatory-like domain-containing protein, partial [Deltaproteobacteria bacterium]|nr:carboxypeptidase regulatory-like domain-containing protein [Deltaproteobacteria bacterium]